MVEEAGQQAAARRSWLQPVALSAALFGALLLLCAQLDPAPLLGGVTVGALLGRRRGRARTGLAPPTPPAARRPRPLPPCDADLLSRLLDDDGSVTWAAGDPTPSFTAQLQLPHCALRRFTPDEARQCLAGRPLVFIGDSLSRFLYLSLVAFLDNATWPALADSPSLMVTTPWAPPGSGRLRRMGAFLQGSTDFFQGRMLCDCFPHSPDHLEHRSWAHPGLNLSAHFMWWRGHPEELKGHWGHPPFLNATPCAPTGRAHCGKTPPDWHLPLPQALRTVVPRLRPAALVINSGVWRAANDAFKPPWPAGLAASIARAAAAAVAPQAGVALWRTTAPSLGVRFGRELDAPLLAEAAAAAPGLRLWDAYGMLRPLTAFRPPPMYDNMHYWPEANAELNAALLNMLC